MRKQTMPAVIWKNLFLLILLSIFSALNLPAQSPLTISVDPNHPGTAISPEFSGLSFETSQVLPDKNGVRYFRPENQPLLSLFQNLGIKNLRVGGNTADRSAKRLPDTADIDSLFAFAREAGVKVIYCLRLHNGNADQDAQVAKYIMDHYAAQLDCFSIGQEPNVYPKVTNSFGVVTPRPSYADYRIQWKYFENTLVAQVPDARFCGPSVDANSEWPREFMTDFGQGYHVTLITAHLYPGRSGDKVPTPESGRDQMLSSNFTGAYQKFYDGFATQALAAGFPYRLEEVNNYFNGGAANVSDTFAAALWGLDFMYWWADHGAAGINFHTGDNVSAGDSLRPSKYTAYYTATNGFQIRPLGYGIKAFNLGAHGRFIPANVSNPQNINVSAYAVLGDDKDVYITLINKEHGADARDADVSLVAGTGYNKARIVSLIAPDNDVSSKTGLTLGGVALESNTDWNGKWSDLGAAESGAFVLKIPAASASIIKLSQD